MWDKQKNSKTDILETADTTATAATSSTSNSRRSAMIGSTIKIKGDVTGEENLIVEGQIDGSIDFTSHEVTVGQTGKVTANVKAKVVKIEGEVNGDITGNEKVVISKSGKVQGNIVAPRVTLEDGAKFKGSIDMDPAGSAAVESAVTPFKSAVKSESKSEQNSIEGVVGKSR